MIAKYLLVWILLALVAIANGILRQGTYGKFVPELAAHQVSTVTAILLTGTAIWVANRVWPIESASQAMIIGACWLLMTIAFEFGFGHYVAGHPWARLFADYNLLAGRVWLFFLVWIAIAPLVVYKVSQIAAG